MSSTNTQREESTKAPALNDLAKFLSSRYTITSCHPLSAPKISHSHGSRSTFYIEDFNAPLLAATHLLTCTPPANAKPLNFSSPGMVTVALVAFNGIPTPCSLSGSNPWCQTILSLQPL
ncbi:cycling DOF factor 2 [Striga asiatica]|uniref:Cycling DOF factor 2 n=1 Tax=Striga asiatica TaxID=4170 RepID=A0A5A7PLD3_STRAF|nr:cycling DOF factor 2 [Striga asiatica]